MSVKNGSVTNKPRVMRKGWRDWDAHGKRTPQASRVPRNVVIRVFRKKLGAERNQSLLFLNIGLRLGASVLVLYAWIMMSTSIQLRNPEPVRKIWPH